MTWFFPLKLAFFESANPNSFKAAKPDETALPLRPHPGAFGVVRKNHVHEGIDLYCADGTPVHAVEDGLVVAILPFTGPQVGSDWWHDTDAILVEGASGVVVYGEVTPDVKAGDMVKAGRQIGRVKTVLTQDKGRPMSMLHLELHETGTRDVYEWTQDSGKPASLRDPTEYLRHAKR